MARGLGIVFGALLQGGPLAHSKKTHRQHGYGGFVVFSAHYHRTDHTVDAPSQPYVKHKTHLKARQTIGHLLRQLSRRLQYNCPRGSNQRAPGSARGRLLRNGQWNHHALCQCCRQRSCTAAGPDRGCRKLK